MQSPYRPLDRQPFLMKHERSEEHGLQAYKELEAIEANYAEGAVSSFGDRGVTNDNGIDSGMRKPQEL